MPGDQRGAGWLFVAGNSRETFHLPDGDGAVRGLDTRGHEEAVGGGRELVVGFTVVVSAEGKLFSHGDGEQYNYHMSSPYKIGPMLCRFASEEPAGSVVAGQV